jgi:hypothetical protein
MKQLIVCAAMLPLLLAFVMQFMLMEQRYSAVMRSEGAVRASANRASYEGGFSADNEARLRNEIAAAFRIGSDSILMNLDRSLGDEGEDVAYDIRISTGRIIAVPRAFGISNENNEGTLQIRGATPNLLHLAAQAKGQPAPSEEKNDEE